MKPRILTLTLNPSLDVHLPIPRLVPDRKLNTGIPHRLPGGGGINVSRALNHLGQDSRAMFFAGAYNGQALTRMLREGGISCLPVPCRDNTRENLMILDESSGLQYQVILPGPRIQKGEAARFLRDLKALGPVDWVIASGSLPPGIPADFLARIASIGKKMGAHVVVDASGEPLKAALEEGVFLVKPNLGELSGLIGKKDLDQDQTEAAAKAIVGKGQSEVVVVSMGASGALLVTWDQCQHIPAPIVKPKNTVGAGDSMVAGMVWGLSRNMEPYQAAGFGIACGAASTLKQGSELGDLKTAERLFRSLFRKIEKR